MNRFVQWLKAWPWCHHGPDSTQEAQAALEELEGQTAEIAVLGAELREMRLSNHFRKMVRGAIGPREQH